jgi:hypothetical protein
MSRVWKKFFIKVGKGLSVVAYVLGSMFVGGLIAGWLGFDIEVGIFAGAFVMVFLPMIAILLRDVYRESKLEVQIENNKIMQQLGKKS